MRGLHITYVRYQSHLALVTTVRKLAVSRCAAYIGMLQRVS